MKMIFKIAEHKTTNIFHTDTTNFLDNSYFETYAEAENHIRMLMGDNRIDNGTRLSINKYYVKDDYYGDHRTTY